LDFLQSGPMVRWSTVTHNIKVFTANNSRVLQWRYFDTISVIALLSIFVFANIIFYIDTSSPSLVAALRGANTPEFSPGYIINGREGVLIDARNRWVAQRLCYTLNVTCSVYQIKDIDDPAVWGCINNLSHSEGTRCGRIAAHAHILRSIANKTDDAFYSVFNDDLQFNNMNISIIHSLLHANASLPLRFYGGAQNETPSAYVIKPSKATLVVDDIASGIPFLITRDLIIGNAYSCPGGGAGIVCPAG
jgi:hypothetical protein